MMPKFSSPFGRTTITNIDEALSVDVSKFLKFPDAPQQFIESINRLTTIRQILIVAQESNIIATIPNIQEVIQVYQWLNLQDVTLPWQGSPRLTEYAEITEDKSSQLNSVVQQLTDHLNSDQTYKTGELLLGAIRAQKKLNTEPTLSSLLDIHEKRLSNLAAVSSDAISTQLADVTKGIDNRKAATIEEINKLADGKIADIKIADSLKEWQGYYDKLLDTQQTGGKEARPTIIQSEGQIRLEDVINFVRLISWHYKRRRDRNYGYVDQTKKFKFWRTFWLIALVSLTIVLTIYFKLHDSFWSYTDDLTQILSIKIATALLFGSLYISANKNYRIYANLTDQTKHRAVVAKTIRTIVLDDKLDEKEEKYKQELVAIAAKAMFELKPIGHISKKEGASPLVEIFRDIRP